MQVEQAIFTSARTARMAGYHLVARSPGIDEGVAARLGLWGPTHDSLATADDDAWTLSCFPVDQNWMALARTCYGGPEYSERGGRRIVTRFLLFTAAQWSRYGEHPLRVFHTASVLGHLRLLPHVPERLPAVDLPDETPLCVEELSPRELGFATLLERTRRCLDTARGVVLVGMPDPLAVLETLFARTADEQRRQLSFSTGLKVSVRRPFRLHFLPQAQPALRAHLHAMGIDCLLAN